MWKAVELILGPLLILWPPDGPMLRKILDPPLVWRWFPAWFPESCWSSSGGGRRSAGSRCFQSIRVQFGFRIESRSCRMWNIADLRVFIPVCVSSSQWSTCWAFRTPSRALQRWRSCREVWARSVTSTWCRRSDCRWRWAEFCSDSTASRTTGSTWRSPSWGRSTKVGGSRAGRCGV